jgi:hypothetical protein
VNLQPRSEQITVQQEFLWQTAGLIHKVGNVTLDAAAFDGVVKAGTVVAVGGNDLAVPYVASVDGGAAANGAVYVITNDIEVGDNNVQVGALEEAYLNRNRITAASLDRLELDSGYRFKLRG